MKLYVQILSDTDEVLFEHRADASTPSRWNTPSGQKLVSKMPQTSDQVNTGTYELFGVTFQPHVRVDRPNGYTTPIPSPNNGQPQNFPAQKQQVPWGMSAPTKPVSSAPNILSQGLAPTRN